MAEHWVFESFDHVSTEAPFLTKTGWAAASFDTPQTAIQYEACAEYPLSLGAGGGGRFVEYAVPAADAAATFSITCRLRPSAHAQTFLRLYGDGGTVLHVYVVRDTVNDRLDVYRGDSTLLGSTSNGSVTTAAWHDLGITVVIGDTGTGLVIVLVDGAIDLFVGADTRNGGVNGTADYFIIGGANGLAVGHIDDLTVNVGGNPPGNLGIVCRRPARDEFVEWTPSTGTDHWALLDDDGPGVGAMPDTTDYVSTSTDGERELFSFPAYPASVNAADLVAVQSCAYARGTGSLVPLLRVGGLVYTGPAVALTAGWRFVVAQWVGHPSGSGGLAWADVAGEAAGFQLAGSQCDVAQFVCEVALNRFCPVYQDGHVGAIGTGGSI